VTCEVGLFCSAGAILSGCPLSDAVIDSYGWLNNLHGTHVRHCLNNCRSRMTAVLMCIACGVAAVLQSWCLLFISHTRIFYSQTGMMAAVLLMLLRNISFCFIPFCTLPYCQSRLLHILAYGSKIGTNSVAALQYGKQAVYYYFLQNRLKLYIWVMWFYVKYISFNICDAEIIVFHWRDLCRQKWTDKKDTQKVKDKHKFTLMIFIVRLCLKYSGKWKINK